MTAFDLLKDVPPESKNYAMLVVANVFPDADPALYERLRAEVHELVYKPEYESIHARVVYG